MADTHAMSELLQAPTKGYRDAIVIPAILAEDFKLKVGLLQLVTSSQFHGFESDNPHAHIRWFNKITSMLKYKNVPNDTIKLMRIPFSLEGAAQTWLEKEPLRSIHTWEDLVSKFVNYFFPPLKTTNLKNDITNFQQKFNETFSEAWDRFKYLLRKCPHHAAGGNHLNRTPRDALAIIKNKSKVRTSRNKLVVSEVNTTTSSSSHSPDITALTDIVKELVLMNKANQQASVKAIEESCMTCDGSHLNYLSGLTPTRMTLKLATRSYAYPAGIAEDVFVQVEKFTLPADFVVIDYDVDPHVPLILWRPFLRTAHALVDVHGEELILRDDDEQFIFHADSTLKHPHKHGNESINMINFIDITCDDRFPKVLKFKKLNHPSIGSTTPLSDSSPSLTPFETSDSLLEEFADELVLLDPFPPGKEDNNFDFEADLREIEFLLNVIHRSDDEWKKLFYGDGYKDIDYEKDKNKDSKIKSLVVEAHIVESDDLLP
nr:reverse transcriptase domain-containing protein [Tanacetum cinerariifolium]